MKYFDGLGRLVDDNQSPPGQARGSLVEADPLNLDKTLTEPIVMEAAPTHRVIMENVNRLTEEQDKPVVVAKTKAGKKKSTQSAGIEGVEEGDE
jgi:hypothetical protein